MNKEQRWELRYVSKLDGSVKNCYPRSEEKKNAQLAICKENGIKVIHCKKLYPFNTWKNQHNFMLIANICSNRMHDMDMGEIPYSEAEYDRLQARKEQADRLFCMAGDGNSEITWLYWEDWKAAKELTETAILHRQEACIASGRPDLVQYC